MELISSAVRYSCKEQLEKNVHAKPIFDTGTTMLPSQKERIYKKPLKTIWPDCKATTKYEKID